MFPLYRKLMVIKENSKPIITITAKTDMGYKLLSKI